MPQIPQYGGPQVRQQPLPGGSFNAPDVGQGARAVAGALNQAAGALEQIVDRDATAEADAADASITTNWLRWDAENRKKYRGANADGYVAAAEDWWKKTSEEFGKTLSDPAKRKVSSALVRKQGSALANVVQFVGAEKERHADEAASAKITKTIQFGVTTGAVVSTAAQVRESVADIGARKGWTTEQVQAEQLKHLSQLHTAQIAKLAEDNAADAQAYYQANKEEVLAANQPRIEQVLKAETDNQFASKEALRLLALPPDQRTVELAKITDPQRREKTQHQVKLEVAARREAQREQEDKMADTAWQLFAQDEKIPEAILSGMDGKGRVQLQEAQRARVERLARREPVKTDMATYIDLRQRLAAGEKINLAGYGEKIAMAQMEQLLDIKDAAAKGGVKQDSMLTDHQRVEAAIAGLGLDPKKNKDHAVEAGLIASEIDRRVRAASAEKGGKQLTADEKQKLVDAVVLDKVYVDSWSRDSQKPVVAMSPEQLKTAYVRVGDRDVLVSSVPQDHRRAAIRALQRVGKTVTEQAIVERYLMDQADAKQPNSAVNQIPR